MGMGDQRHAPAALSPGKRCAMPILYETGWPSGPICTGVEYIAPTGIRSPTDQPAVSSYTYYDIPAHMGTTLANQNSIHEEIKSTMK